MYTELNLVADTHCDTLGFVDLGKSSVINEYNASKKYDHLQVFAMYCAEEGETDRQSFERACRYTSLYKKAVAEKTIKHCTTFAEIERAVCEKTKYISMLSIEGGECLEGSLENAHRFYEDGVRMIAPVWNHNNVWASGSYSTGTSEDKGLSEKGADLIGLCEKIGIIVDISHSSDNTIKDILSITKRPLCASHSNFRSVCNHNRNLTDDFAIQISDRGGYIGLNIYYQFVRENIDIKGASYDISELIPHIDHAKKLGVADKLGFGFDIDGVSGNYPRDTVLSDSIHDLFIEKMSMNNFGHDFVRGVSGKNFMNFLKRYGL